MKQISVKRTVSLFKRLRVVRYIARTARGLGPSRIVKTSSLGIACLLAGAILTTGTKEIPVPVVRLVISILFSDIILLVAGTHVGTKAEREQFAHDLARIGVADEEDE